MAICSSKCHKSLGVKFMRALCPTCVTSITGSKASNTCNSCNHTHAHTDKYTPHTQTNIPLKLCTNTLLLNSDGVT